MQLVYQFFFSFLFSSTRFKDNLNSQISTLLTLSICCNRLYQFWCHIVKLGLYNYRVVGIWKVPSINALITSVIDFGDVCFFLLNVEYNFFLSLILNNT